jgi:hypothetical protein
MKEHLRRLGLAVRRAVEAADSARRRREAETRLEEERDFLVDVFSSVQDGLVVLDADLKIVRTNSTMEKLFPDRMPLVGRAAGGLCPAAAEKIRTATLRDGQPAQIVCALETAQGPGEFSVFAYPLVERRSGRQRARSSTPRRHRERRLSSSCSSRGNGKHRQQAAACPLLQNILQASSGSPTSFGRDRARDRPMRRRRNPPGHRARHRADPHCWRSAASSAAAEDSI